MTTNGQTRAQKDVTSCITSCGRVDLLAQTLESFLPQHKKYFAKSIIIDDANSSDVEHWIRTNYPETQILLNSPQLGQMKSIDRMYSHVETPFIFHGEDDWLFNTESTIEACKAVMSAEPKVSVVCVRKVTDLQKRFQENCIRKEVEGVRYALMPTDIHPEWLSFSFNPGLVRKSLWERYGPYEQYGTEERISMAMKKDGWMVAFLDPGSCIHIGGEAHVNDPFQPQRAKTIPARLKRSIRKRVFRILRKFGFDL